MKIIIDRFEEDIAVVELEDGELLNVPKILFADAREGDTVEINILKRPAANEPETPNPQKDTASPDDTPADIFRRLRQKRKKENI